MINPAKRGVDNPAALNRFDQLCPLPADHQTDGVLTVEPAGDALVVLHTPPGEANRVAVALDRLAWPDVVGTIAGDDTIFLAVKDNPAQRRVMSEVRRLSGG